MSTNKKMTAMAVLWAAGLVAGYARAEVVVVVSAKNATTSLSAEDASALFLGKSPAFPGGALVSPIDQTEGSPLRDEFYSKAARKSPAQLKAYWSKQMFAGKAQPPREVGGSVEVRKAVAGDANAIGYIDKSAVDSSVKVVLVP